MPFKITSNNDNAVTTITFLLGILSFTLLMLSFIFAISYEDISGEYIATNCTLVNRTIVSEICSGHSQNDICYYHYNGWQFSDIKNHTLFGLSLVIIDEISSINSYDYEIGTVLSCWYSTCYYTPGCQDPHSALRFSIYYDPSLFIARILACLGILILSSCVISILILTYEYKKNVFPDSETEISLQKHDIQIIET